MIKEGIESEKCECFHWLTENKVKVHLILLLWFSFIHLNVDGKIRCMPIFDFPMQEKKADNEFCAIKPKTPVSCTQLVFGIHI